MSSSTEPKSRSKILGIGVVFSGLFFLGIAVIFRFQFPKYVARILLPFFCVCNNTSLEYSHLAYKSYRTTIDRLYIWEIMNKEGFIRNGHHPQFRLRGPYVYKETRFESDSQRHNENLTMKYDEELTQSECKVDGQLYKCSNSDMVTVINPFYLRKMKRFGSLSNFISHHIPRTYKRSYEPVPTSKSTTAILNFHSWVQTNDTIFKNHIIMSMYIFNGSSLDQILNLPSLKSDGLLEVGEHLKYKIILDEIKKMAPVLCRNSMSQSCVIFVSEKLEILNKYSFVKILKEIPKWPPQTSILALSAHLCSNIIKLRHCEWFKLMSVNESIQRSYLISLHDYFNSYLVDNVIDGMKSERKLELLLTIPVEMFSIGLSEDNAEESNIGLLSNLASDYVLNVMKDAEVSANVPENTSFYSTKCAANDRNISSPNVPTELFEYSSVITPVDLSNPCMTSEPIETIEIFVASISRTFKYVRQRPAEIDSNKVFLYTLSSEYRGRRFDSVKLKSYSMVATPYYCPTCQDPDRRTGHGNKVYVEPLTGTEWYGECTYNFSVTVKPEYIRTSKFIDYNISEEWMDVLLPYVTWGRQIIPPEGGFYFKEKAKLLLNIACIGHILFGIGGIVLIIIGMKIGIKNNLIRRLLETEQQFH